MTPDRCPACGAAVAPGAPWCTLCFTDLRPKPEPVPEPVSEPVSEPVREPVAAAVATAASAPTPPTPVTPVAPERAAAPTWPCTTCGASVALELDACPACGAGFLAEAKSAGLEIQLPGVGDPRHLSNGAKWVIGGVGATAIMLVLLVIAVIGGALL